MPKFSKVWQKLIRCKKNPNHLLLHLKWLQICFLKNLQFFNRILSNVRSLQIKIQLQDYWLIPLLIETFRYLTLNQPLNNKLKELTHRQSDLELTTFKSSRRHAQEVIKVVPVFLTGLYLMLLTAPTLMWILKVNFTNICSSVCKETREVI